MQECYKMPHITCYIYVIRLQFNNCKPVVVMSKMQLLYENPHRNCEAKMRTSNY